MTPLVLTLTDAGIAALRAAAGTAAVVLAHIGLSARAVVMAPTLTALPDEHRRLATVSGTAVDDRTIHLTTRDASDATYVVRAIGLYLADGTLFAAYSQPDPIFEKARVATYLQAIDLRLQPGEAALVTFGDSNFLYPPASETVQGVVAIATQDDVVTGTDTRRAVVPATLAVRLAALLTTVNASIASAVETLRTQLLDAIAQCVPLTRRIDTSGLATGGGGLDANRTIAVLPASAEQLLAATATDVALTPASFGGIGQVIGGHGSYTLPGGVIVKWGRYRSRADSEVTRGIPFDLAFPATCFCVLLTPCIAVATINDDYFVQLVGDPTAQGFTVQYQSDDANGGLDGFDWLAIGR